VKLSRKVRKGSGKARNRRHVERKGPILVYLNEETKVPFAFRNIPGIEICHVSRLNLLQLAPGGHLGRFVIWVEDAFKSLDNIFGTFTRESLQKKGWKLPQSTMTNTDLARIINSDEIQQALRPKIHQQRFNTRKKNPLKNFGTLVKLNPYALTQRRRVILSSERSKEKRKEKLQKKRAGKLFKDQLFAPMAIMEEKKKRVPEEFDQYVYNAPATTYVEIEEEEEKPKEEEGEGEGKEDTKEEGKEKGKAGKGGKEEKGGKKGKN